MTKKKKKYIFYGSPYMSKTQGKVIHPYVVMEFSSFKKVKKYLNAQSWNLMFSKDGVQAQFMVLSVEEYVKTS